MCVAFDGLCSRPQSFHAFVKAFGDRHLRPRFVIFPDFDPKNLLDDVRKTG